MKISFFIAWYDFWIGLYYDRKENNLYVCFLPCLVLKIEKDKEPKMNNPNTKCLNCKKTVKLSDGIIYFNHISQSLEEEPLLNLVHKNCAQKQIEKHLNIILSKKMPIEEKCSMCFLHIEKNIFESYIVIDADSEKISKICHVCQKSWNPAFKIFISSSHSELMGIDQLNAGKNLFETEMQGTKLFFTFI